MKRYDQLLQLIDLFQPKDLVEIGTWSGDNAVRMIKTAQKYHPDVTYTGYDLFEEATAETDAVEFNVKRHNNVHTIQEKIAELCPGVKVTLIKGNTRDTLLSHTPKGDFCFIDGGHSVDTIMSDYLHCNRIPVIIFDDYYEGGPDTALVGCNFLVDSKKPGFHVLPGGDPVRGGGVTRLVLKV